MDYVKSNQDIENVQILDYSVKAMQWVVAYNDLTNVYNAFNLDLAVGVDLDILLAPFLGQRRSASPAITEVTITIDEAQDQDITYPIGTVINSESNSNINFSTIEAVTIFAGQTSVTAAVQCNQTGPQGNVPANDLTIFSGQGYGATVTNQYPASGGTNIESDDSYRARGYQWKSINVKGTYWSIVDAITSVSAVTGYFIQQFWDGYGSTLIVIDPPLDTVIGLVEAEVDKVKALDEDITIVPVETVEINVDVVVNVNLNSTIQLSLPEEAQIQAQVASAIETYVNGGINQDGTPQHDLGIGNWFIPFLMEKYVAGQVSQIQNMVSLYPTDPVEIASNQKAVIGTVNVSVS